MVVMQRGSGEDHGARRQVNALAMAVGDGECCAGTVPSSPTVTTVPYHPAIDGMPSVAMANVLGVRWLKIDPVGSAVVLSSPVGPISNGRECSG